MISLKRLIVCSIIFVSHMTWSQIMTHSQRLTEYKKVDSNRALGNYDDASRQIQLILQKDSIQKDSLKIAYDLIRLSEISRLNDKTRNSSDYILRAYQYNLTEDKFTNALLKNEFANLAVTIGALKLALEYKIDINLIDTNSSTKFYDAGLIGSIYIQLNETPNALKYFELQNKIANEENNFLFKVQALNNLAYYHQVLNNYDVAIEQYTKILDLHLDTINPAYINSSGNLGACFYKIQSYKQAIKYLNINYQDRLMAKDASQILSLGVNLYDSYVQTKNPKADAIFKEINNHFDKASLENKMLVISYFLSQEDKHGFTFDQYKSLVTEKDKALKLKEVVKYEIISSLLEKIAKQKETNIEKTKEAAESNLTISKRNNSIILLISGIVVSLLIFLTTIWFLKRKNVQTKNLLVQERNQHLSSQLELKKKNVQELAIDINMRRELSNKLIEKLDNIDYSNESIVRNQIGSVKKEIKNFNLSTKSFEYINDNIDLISQDFFDSLELKHPGLTKYEKELCSYLKLGMNNKEISNIIHISPSSVRTSKSRLKKKLHINEDLYNYLKSL